MSDKPRKSRHLRYNSRAHAQIENSPIRNEADANERAGKAITNFYKAVLGDGAKRPPSRKRSKPKRKP